MPAPVEVVNHILPPAFSTIALQIARPKPVPEDLVVKFGLKILERNNSFMPLPESVTETITSLFCINCFICTAEFAIHHTLQLRFL